MENTENIENIEMEEEKSHEKLINWHKSKEVFEKCKICFVISPEALTRKGPMTRAKSRKNVERKNEEKKS